MNGAKVLAAAAFAAMLATGAVALAGDAPRLSLEEYQSLKALLEDASSKGFRDAAANTRLDSGLAEKVDKLLGSLASGSGVEKELAAMCLARSADERAPAALAGALSEDDKTIKLLALSGLARMKPEQTKPVKEKLLGAFKDADESVRAMAVRVVGSQADEETIPAMTEMLSDAAWQPKVSAAQALAQFKDKASSAVPALEKALTDENAFVRLFAARAILLITGRAPEGAPEMQPQRNPLADIHGLMAEATKRLESSDVGVPTREVQHRIVSDLDKLIDALQKSQPKGGGGKGSGQSQQESEGAQQAGKPTSGAKGGNNPSSPMSDSFSTSGATQHGQKRSVVEEEGAEWGRLPDKLREEVDQALKENFPDRYKDLLKRYYIRLSEDEK
jgi:HEAT repeat protein